MFPRRFLIAAVVAVAVLGLVLAANSAGQQQAWMQGYTVGRLSAGAGGSGDTGALLPYMYPGMGGWHRGGFGFLGPFFFLGLIVLAVVAARHACFGHHRGPWGQGGPRGPQGPHGWHRPPWWDWDEEQGQRPPEGPRPEGPAGQA